MSRTPSAGWFPSPRAWASPTNSPAWCATSSITPTSTAKSSASTAPSAWAPSKPLLENFMTDPIVIVAARRTPIGAFQGQFAAVTAPQLGSAAIAGVLADIGKHAADIDEAILGCCLYAGLKQAPARQAVLGAGLSPAVPSTTLTKMCGSGMKATMLVHDLLLAGTCPVEEFFAKEWVRSVFALAVERLRA